MKIILGLCLFFLPVSWAQESVPWELLSTDDGIKVYRREVPGSPLIAFKGEGVIDASIAKVANVVMDDDRATEWMDKVVESRMVKRINVDETIQYTHVETPFVMKDRDFVTHGRVEVDPKKKTFALRFNSEEVPEAPKTDYVRGNLIDSSFFLTSLENGTKTHIVAEIHCDPKGSVPKWIVNMFQKGWPRNTIESMRKQVAKPGIVEHPHYKKFFQPEPKPQP